MMYRHGSRLFLLTTILLASATAEAKALLEVRVEPARKALKANIEAFIGDLGERDEEALRLYRRIAEDQARQAAQALGYYQARIDSAVESGQDKQPRLRLHVVPGEPVRLRQVNVRIDGEASAMAAFRVPRSERLKPGARLDHGAYEDAKKLIQNQALRYGFFDGRFTSQRLDVDPAEGAADIDLVYDSGRRYSLGEVSFHGDTPFDEELLRRFIPFKDGDGYDADQIAAFNQNLQASGYFALVRVDAIPAEAQAQRIPVKVELKAVEPRTVGLGVGYATDVGPRAKASWTRHWVNPQGHSLGFDSEASLVRQNVSAWYQIPLDPPLTDTLRFTSGLTREELEDVESRKLSLGAQWQHQLAKDWMRVVSLRWEQEHYDFGDGSPDGVSNFLMPGVSYDLLRSDSPVDPSQGYRLQMDAVVAKQGLVSDADMVRFNGVAKGLYTFSGGHRLLGRAQIGLIATNDFSAIPPSLRFFAGGDQSVRGYDYQSLSPEDHQHNKVGARYLMVASAEYQYPIAKSWRLATFVDHGNAVDSPMDGGKTGVGFGVRWVSPVGPIRVDLAHALDEPGGVRLHFSMGPEL
ncbi:autotransporter assembly complex protein TamA [Pseudomonas sp. LRF_L74]|uniref:autotransporter assembly complex protein TamA n=1 Tax=Pseudomonas sp. LRF_L74 TaxID=3369422 RepID=UPI003F5E7AE9